MTNVTATRVFEGIELPSPGLWAIDPGHAEIGFVGRHFMMTRVRGRFGDVAGEVHIAERPDESSVRVEVGMGSVYSGDKTRDSHLVSSDLFDVARYPHALFVSTGVVWKGSKGELTGELTIKDVTNSVDFTVSYTGYALDPWGNDRAGFEAKSTINREDWGLTWNMFLESGGMMVSKEIELEIDLELVRVIE